MANKVLEELKKQYPVHKSQTKVEPTKPSSSSVLAELKQQYPVSGKTAVQPTASSAPKTPGPSATSMYGSANRNNSNLMDMATRTKLMQAANEMADIKTRQAKALENPRASTAYTRQTEKQPMQDRAQRVAEIRKGIDTTPKRTGLGAGLQSIGLSLPASIEYGGATIKQGAKDTGEYLNTAEAQAYAEAVAEFNRISKTAMEDSPEYLAAVEKVNNARALLDQAKARTADAVDPNSRAARLYEEYVGLQEEALKNTSGIGRDAAELALNVGNFASKLPLGPLAAPALAAEAAAGKMYDVQQAGGSAAQAVGRGAVAGAIEYFTEKIGIDNMMGIIKKTGGAGLWDVATQVFAEGGEEGLSYVFNWIADKVAGDPEAEFVWKDFLRSAAMGAASGGIIGSVATVANRVRLGETGKAYQDVAPELVAEGLQMKQDTDAYRTAAEMQRKLDAGKTLSNVDVGRVVRDNETTMAPLRQAAMEMAEAEVKQRAAERTATVSKSLGYGKEGARVFGEIYNGGEVDAKTLLAVFDTPYQAGLTGGDGKQYTDPMQIAAYSAGNSDRIAQQGIDTKAKPGKVFSKTESGFDYTNAPADLTQQQKNFGNLMAKTFGIKGNFVKGETAYNARYVSNVGEVNFAKDFGIDQQLMQKLGDMDFQQKVERLANKRQQSFAFYVAHEIADHVAANRAPVEMRAFNNAMYNYLRETEGANLARERMAFYGSRGANLDTKGAIEEVAADSILMLYDGDEQKFMTAMERVLNGTDERAKRGAKTWGEALKNIIEKLKAWARKLTGRDNAQAKADVEKSVAELERLRDMFEAAIAKAAQNTEQARNAGATKNTTQEGGVQHSLHQFADGRRFVDVNVDQEQFDGLSVAEMNSRAKKIIKSKFSGKVVGIDNKVFVNGKSAEKYVYYPHGTEDSVIEAKARASTELDNLIDAGTNFRTAEDGADGHVHPDAVGGFSYFDTIFKVGDQYYKGVVNIKNIGKGRLSHGVTKVENITQDIHDSYGENPTIIFLRDVSMETVPHPEDNVKNDDQYSLKNNGNKYASKTYAEITEEQYALNQRERSLEQRKREANSNPELLQAMADYHSLFSEMRELSPKKRNGTATQAELDRYEELKALREERMSRLVELQESLGLGEISKEETAIREEKEALRVAADAAWKREGAEKENKAIEKSGLSAPEYFRKKALKAFKTTANFNEAGYMLPDGKLLNFSGGERNHRYRDHREIGEIYEATQGTDALNRFLSDGNIRVMAESPGIDIAAGVEPTKEQYAALRRFINSHGTKDGQFFVDFSGEDGRRVGNYAYEGRVISDRVINDIKYFYETGETREESSVSKFLYSLKGEQQMAKELKRIRDEGKKAGKSAEQIRAEVAQVVGPEYAELLKTYGAIERGETPFRDVQVPERTGKNRKVSQTVRTILEAEATPDAMIPDVEALVAEGALSFESYTDNQAIADATAKLVRDGWDDTLRAWQRDNEAGKISKAHTVTGWALYNAAANKGDVKTALDILQDMVLSQRMAAQALQATRVLKQLAPEAQLYGVQRSVEKLQRDIDSRSGYAENAAEIQREVGGARREAADKIKKAYSGAKVRGGKVVVDGNQAGEPFVFEYAQKVGEALAKSLTPQKATAQKTFLQQITSQLRRFASEKMQKASHEKAMTATELLRDYIQNQSFYTEAWEAAQNELREQYADDERMAEFINSGIGVDATLNPRNAVFMQALVKAAAESKETRAMIVRQSSLGVTGMANNIAEQLIRETGAEGSMADTIRDAAAAYVNEVLRESDTNQANLVNASIKNAMSDIGVTLSKYIVSDKGQKATVEQAIVDKLIAKYSFGLADATLVADVVRDHFNTMASAAARKNLASRFKKRTKNQKSLEQVMQELGNLGAFDIGSVYNEAATEKVFKLGVTLKVNEELAQRFLEAENQDERDAALREIYADLGRQMPSTFIDRWNAWRYLSMLGNARTQVRNVAGNLFFAPVVTAKNLTATAIESVVSRAVKVERTKSIVGGTALTNVFNKDRALIIGGKTTRKLLEAAWADYANVADQIAGGGKYSEFKNANQIIEANRTIFKNKRLEKARTAVSGAMEIGDVWFSQPHYAAALASYCKANDIPAAQIVKGGSAMDKARTYAIKEAQKATYRDINGLSNLFSRRFNEQGDYGWVGKAANTVMEGILPFRKTPANILARGLEYSPLGLLKSLTIDIAKANKAASADKPMLVAQAIDNAAAGLTGTGLAVLGFLLAKLGLIRGAGEKDEKEREFAELQGHQAYSMELPDGTSVTLDWLAPEALPFFIGVNLWEMTEGKKEEIGAEAITAALKALGAPMLELSCLQSLNDVLSAAGSSYGKGAPPVVNMLAAAATSYVTQFLPTIFGQIERSFQKERMTTYSDKNKRWIPADLQYTIGKATAKIPGLDYQQIPYIDAWGRTESTGNFAENAFGNLLNPSYTSRIDTTAMEDELLRLYRSTGESVFPSRAARYFMVNNERKDLTAEEYVQYATLKGRYSYELLTELVDSSTYKSLTDAEKAKMVREVFDNANKQAKAAISEYELDDWAAKYAEAEKKYGIKQEVFAEVRMNTRFLASLKDKNGETITNSLSLLKMEAVYNIPGLTDKQRQALFDYLDVGKSVRHYNKSLVKQKLSDMRKKAK